MLRKMRSKRLYSTAGALAMMLVLVLGMLPMPTFAEAGGEQPQALLTEETALPEDDGQPVEEEEQPQEEPGTAGENGLEILYVPEPGQSPESGEEGQAGKEEKPAADAPGEEEEAPEAVDFAYDPQPTSAAEVAGLVAGYPESGNSDEVLAFLLALPKWEFAIEESWLPAGWNQSEFTDGETGATYWRLVGGVQAMALTPLADGSLPVYNQADMEEALVQIRDEMGGVGAITVMDSFSGNTALGELTLTIKGYNGLAEPPVINGGNARVFSCKGTNLTLEYLDIVEGGIELRDPDIAVINGANVAVESTISKLVMRNVIIRNTNISGLEAGNLADVEIYNSLITGNGNKILGYDALSGGGIYLGWGTVCLIQDSEISYNTAADGGGICATRGTPPAYVDKFATLKIIDTAVIHNDSNFTSGTGRNGGAGGMSLTCYDFYADGLTLADNAGYGIGGAWLQLSGGEKDVTIKNSEILRNRGTGNEATGGIYFFDLTYSVRYENCVFDGNESNAETYASAACSYTPMYFKDCTITNNISQKTAALSRIFATNSQNGRSIYTENCYFEGNYNAAGYRYLTPDDEAALDEYEARNKNVLGLSEPFKVGHTDKHYRYAWNNYDIGYRGVQLPPPVFEPVYEFDRSVTITGYPLATLTITWPDGTTESVVLPDEEDPQHTFAVPDGVILRAGNNLGAELKRTGFAGPTNSTTAVLPVPRTPAIIKELVDEGTYPTTVIGGETLPVVPFGEEFSYRITVTDVGRARLTPLVEDTLENGLEFVTVTASTGTPVYDTDTRTITWEPTLTIASAYTATMEVRVKATEVGVVPNIASAYVLRGFGGGETDPDTSAPPLVFAVMHNDDKVYGKGMEDAGIQLTWPDGNTATTVVGSDNIWSIDVPSTVTLSAGQAITATQTDGTKGVSRASTVTVDSGAYSEGTNSNTAQKDVYIKANYTVVAYHLNLDGDLIEEYVYDPQNPTGPPTGGYLAANPTEHGVTGNEGLWAIPGVTVRQHAAQFWSYSDGGGDPSSLATWQDMTDTIDFTDPSQLPIETDAEGNKILKVYVYYAGTLLDMTMPTTVYFYSLPQTGPVVQSPTYTFENHGDAAWKISMERLITETGEDGTGWFGNDTPTIPLDDNGFSIVPSLSGANEELYLTLQGVGGTAFESKRLPGTGPEPGIRPDAPLAAELGTLLGTRYTSSGGVPINSASSKGQFTIGGQYSGPYPDSMREMYVGFVFHLDLVPVTPDDL